MKNVAGYDVSRLLAGSLGALGVICEVSLKVLPQPVAGATLRFELDQARALQRLQRWGGQPLPLNASAWWDGMLVLRLAGAAAAVQSACGALGGERIARHAGRQLLGRPARPARRVLRRRAQGRRGRRHAVAAVGAADRAAAAAVGRAARRVGRRPALVVHQHPGRALRDAAAAVGGHATLFRGHDKTPGVFAPLSVFNRGRLYPWM
jgi:glycolate oxidase FAD binding subunit